MVTNYCRNNRALLNIIGIPRYSLPPEGSILELVVSIKGGKRVAKDKL